MPSSDSKTSIVLIFAQNEGFGVRALTKSPLLGPKGNIEFLAWINETGTHSASLEEMINLLF